MKEPQDHLFSSAKEKNKSGENVISGPPQDEERDCLSNEAEQRPADTMPSIILNNFDSKNKCSKVLKGSWPARKLRVN